jgi:hypothetical protein
MGAPKNKGGRPRKEESAKKPHRVQIAMSDAQLADARRLSQLQNTSISAAIGAAVTESMHTYSLSTYLETMVPNVAFHISEEHNNFLRGVADSQGITKSELLSRLVIQYITFCTENN